MSAQEEKVVEPVVMSGIMPLDDLKFDDVKFKTEVADNVANITPEDAKLFYSKAEDVGISAKTLDDVNAFEAKYFKGIFDESVKQTEKSFKSDKDIVKVNVVTPFGVNKKDTIGVYTKRAVTHRIPGTDETVTKPSIAVEVIRTAQSMPKAAVKRIRNDLATAIANV